MTATKKLRERNGCGRTRVGTSDETRASVSVSVSASASVTTTTEAEEDKEDKERVRLLCVFRQRYIEFRLPEVEALVKLATGLPCKPPTEPSARARASASASAPTNEGNTQSDEGEKHEKRKEDEDEDEECFQWEYPKGGKKSSDSPFWYLVAPTRAAANALATVINERSVLVKVLLDLWSEGESFEDVVQDLAAEENKEQVDKRKSRLASFHTDDTSFKFIADGFGRKLKTKEQGELIKQLVALLGFKGRVEMKQPDELYYVCHACVSTDNSAAVAGLPSFANMWYFGQYLGSGQGYFMKYNLPDRVYLGPTSMDNEMAAIMANMGQVEKGSMVFDPFVGTGSILVSCAHFGAITVGGDIDIRVIQWGKTSKKGEKVDVWSNFDEYGLPRPLALLRCDAHLLPFRDSTECVFDSIVCDPPYGVRAGGRKSGGKRENMKKVPEEFKDSHIPSTGVYELSECLADLLDLSAKLLRVGGRLVYFFPCSNGIVLEDFLPSHPCLTLEHISEQALTQLFGRKLVTMVKHCDWDPELAKAHREQAFSPGSDLLRYNNLHQMVYDVVDNESPETLQERKQKKRYKSKRV
mmetsp:Transcript_6756/g.12369  ORF Transcript_6756/g.12369 Transcript_6756/m.12369 type:complete len:583 (+) Transcript_6756:155-1903(+)